MGFFLFIFPPSSNLLSCSLSLTHTSTQTHVHTQAHIHYTHAHTHTHSHSQGAPVYVNNDDCHYVFKWETQYACSLNLPVSKLSKDICSMNDSASNFNYDFRTLVQKNHPLKTTDNSGNSYYIQLCGTNSPSLSAGDSAGCDASNTGICRKSGSSSAQTLVYAEHKFVMTSHSPHVVEVVFPSGTTCDNGHSKKWSAYVRLACATGGEQTPLPVFQRDSDCELHFVWQNSSFCVGVESCSAEDPSTHYVYNLDGLLSSTWTVSC